MSENDNDLIGNADAMVWAERFAQRASENPRIPTDAGTMLAWFSGAMMAGHDAAVTREQQRAITALGVISAELAARADAWNGNAPEWLPEPPEWLSMWEKALADA